MPKQEPQDEIKQLVATVDALREENLKVAAELRRQLFELAELRRKLGLESTRTSEIENEARQRVVEAEKRLASMETSRSWKLTRPLRALFDLFSSPPQIRSQPGHPQKPPRELFDEQFYREQAPEELAHDQDAFEHYLQHGRERGLDPHPLFDARYYLTQYPDVAGSGEDPFVHFCEWGAAENRNPSPLFDTEYYLANGPALDEASSSAFEHYLVHGSSQGRSPNLFFDRAFYFEQYPDVASAGVEPLGHFQRYGGAEGRSPGPLFDTQLYLANNPQLDPTESNPLVHYLLHGAAGGRPPCAVDHGPTEHRWLRRALLEPLD